MIDHREIAQKRLDLTAVYQKLTAVEKSILQFCSIVYEPAARTAIVNALNQLGIRTSAGKFFTASTLVSLLESLIAKKMLIQERGGSVVCNPIMVEVFTRDAIQTENFEKMVEASIQLLPIRNMWQGGAYIFSSYPQFMRVFRWGIYRQDLEFLLLQIAAYQKFGYQRKPVALDELLEQVCNNPFDPDWFLTLPQSFFEGAIVAMLGIGVDRLIPMQPAFDLLSEVCQPNHEYSSDFLLSICIEQELLRNHIQEAEIHLRQITKSNEHDIMHLWGWLQLLQGDLTGSIASFQIGLAALRKQKKKRKTYFDSISGLFFIFALIQEGSSASLQMAQELTEIITRQREHWLHFAYTSLLQLLYILQGNLKQKSSLTMMSLPDVEQGSSLDILVSALCIYWCDRETAKQRLPKILASFAQQAEFAGLDWLKMEAISLLSQLQPTRYDQKFLAKQRSALGLITLVNLVKTQEPWELCLNALSNFQKKDTSETALATSTTARIAWFLTLYANSYVLQPKEQKRTAQGHWTKGRAIALKRLKENISEFDYLTPQDHQVCACLRSEHDYHGYYASTSYIFDEKAIVALVGHPNVFWENLPDIRIDIVKGEPELLVKKAKGDRLLLQLSPKITSNQTIAFTQETPTRVRVMSITSEHHRIAEILGSSNQLEVPSAAQERVLSAIAAVSGLLTVHSDIGGGMDNVEEVAPDPKPHVHLLPADPGLKISLLTRPFAQGGSYFQPGKGGATVIAEIDGKRLQTTRNLKEEKQLVKSVEKSCPTLQEWESKNNEWLIDDPESCLELMLELQDLEDAIVLEWPEGEKFRIRHRADSHHFQMNIKRQRDWFEASGELKLEDESIINMQQLLNLLDQKPGRFIEIGNGEFIALTDALRSQLKDLRGFSENHGKGIRFHALAALALEETLEGIGQLKTDKYWKDQIQKFREGELLQPQLPSTLQADLRDYQQEGFAWLAKLSSWGVGACLADDMGLGKTLQALALLLTRAPEGASLVIAPTSVCMNWISEAARFAPTLNPIQLGSGDRQKQLDQLQPFDLLVCSYGLLQQEEVAEMLANIEWQTIVLDEAQSIKNFATKRSQAAMKLKAGFKIITTGTPIENHLGELWNLFRFINPGLLGSLESFNQRFANPIERSQDEEARQRLKRLIQPFILRRTKNQVLSELPSRTEILLQVELSPEETAFYEALRQDAIAKLTETDAEAGARHLQVLAEIMKLRRACCNPRLVKPNVKVNSSKLALFAEVLEELLDNKHKALVFSQFVDHLSIIREYLEKNNISYQYLDGSTPARDRKKRVDAFQAGEGDVFLISLKAGGTGLNLTAADYVIHMDPWWNPAVEDQASDRAHRIGQKRPVTIYRLVAQGTIEEKIVDLHHEKRDLANSLLEGTEMSGKVSTEDLIRLIQEG
jgi:SNF2 family DNA or RNA helicase